MVCLINMPVIVNWLAQDPQRLIERWKIAVYRIKAGIATNNSSIVRCKRTHSCLMPCPKGVNISQEKHLVFSFISFFRFYCYLLLSLLLLPLHQVLTLAKC